MTNAEIARTFEKIALILDLQGNENPFRIRAYERAATVLSNLSVDLRSVYETGGIKALRELPGIGTDLASKIEEMLKTGRLAFLTDLEKKVPKGLLEILEIEGMGPKRTKLVWQKFNVRSLKELQDLAGAGKLEEIKGWGEKSVQNILRGIEQHHKVKGRLSLPEVEPLAQEIVEALRKTGRCDRIEVAGSFRRRRESVGDIDILVTSKDPETVMDAFCRLPHVDRVTAKGTTKSTVFLSAGLDADLRVVAPDVFGAALLYFTGSKDHNVRLRRVGIEKRLTLSEYGLFRGTAKRKGGLVAAKSEEEVYGALGLPFIPPELREDRGEIEAAKRGTLPKLLSEEDLRGDLHMHSHFSDGSASIEEMAHAAREKGLAYIAITDHASAMGMVGGIKKEGKSFKEYKDRVHAAQKKVKGIHILLGTEVDIEKSGGLYLPDEMLKEFDWVIASVHQHFHGTLEEETERLRRALQNPYVHVLGHPLARLLGKREGITFDVDAVLSEAKILGKAVELNTANERLDLPDTHLLRAKELGVKVAIGSDAHSPQGMDHRYGIFQARRGWLTKGDVVNCLAFEQFEKWRKGVRGSSE